MNYGLYGLQAEGENGQVKLVVNESTAEVSAAMFGKIGNKVVDQTAEITVKPFDNWSLLQLLVPQYLGVHSAAGAAALLIGTRPHGPIGTNVSSTVWTPDGRSYNLVRTAVTGHPSLHLGVDKPLFGDIKITGLVDPTVGMGAGFTGGGLFTAANAIQESGATDSNAASMTMADFVRSPWTLTWGAGGNGFDVATQADDEWTLETDVKYSPLKVQGLTLGMKLDSVAFMIKGRPYGPTHTNILSLILAHTQGQLLGSGNAALTQTGGTHTITLSNAAVKGCGFDFGGTQLGTDEVGFVSTMTFSGGASQALLTFT